MIVFKTASHLFFFFAHFSLAMALGLHTTKNSKSAYVELYTMQELFLRHWKQNSQEIWVYNELSYM